jgi:hypothetical protein
MKYLNPVILLILKIFQIPRTNESGWMDDWMDSGEANQMHGFKGSFIWSGPSVGIIVRLLYRITTIGMPSNNENYLKAFWVLPYTYPPFKTVIPT